MWLILAVVKSRLRYRLKSTTGRATLRSVNRNRRNNIILPAPNPITSGEAQPKVCPLLTASSRQPIIVNRVAAHRRSNLPVSLGIDGSLRKAQAVMAAMIATGALT